MKIGQHGLGVAHYAACGLYVVLAIVMVYGIWFSEQIGTLAVFWKFLYTFIGLWVVLLICLLAGAVMHAALTHSKE